MAWTFLVALHNLVIKQAGQASTVYAALGRSIVINVVIYVGGSFLLSSNMEWALEGLALFAVFIVWQACGINKAGSSQPVKSKGRPGPCAMRGYLPSAESAQEPQENIARAMPDIAAKRTCPWKKAIFKNLQIGSIAAAEDALESMLVIGEIPTVQLFSSVIDAWAKAGNTTRAEKLTRMMIDHGIQPDAVTFSILILMHAKRSDIQRAELWYHEMNKWNLTPQRVCFATVINVCSKAGDLAGALKWFDMMRAAGVEAEVIVFSSVLDACARCDDLEKASHFFSQMLSSGVALNAVPYTCMARLFGSRGRFRDVEELYQNMESRGIAMNEHCYCALLHAYRKASPRQSNLAGKAFLAALDSGIEINEKILMALRLATSPAQYSELMDTTLALHNESLASKRKGILSRTALIRHFQNGV